MKKPNILLEKKYLSSLVIAAFLILSVLTAYNIRTNPENPEESNTEVEETIGDREGVIRTGEEEPEIKAEGTQEQADSQEEIPEKSQDEALTSDGESAGGRASQRAAKQDHLHYDGKRKLSWPVLGNVILPYSMDTTIYYATLDQYACNDGVLIGAKKGEKITAASDGRVVNIYDSDKYGKTVTILLGDYYEMYYSQLENVKFEVGEEVREGDVIGTVADPTRAFTLEGPHLFLKMTWKGEPVNPTDYLEA